MKTKIKIILTALLAFNAFSVSAASISGVTATDSTRLNVTLTGAGDFSSGGLTWEVKVLQDVSVESATKNKDNQKQIDIVLRKDLEINTSYSILSIFGVEWNIDFSIGATLENTEYVNPDTTGIIQKVIVQDAKHLKVFYITDVMATEFEYKVLSNLKVESITAWMKSSSMDIKLTNTLVSNTSYILMVVSLKWALGQDIALTESIFDFSLGEVVSAMTVIDPTLVWSGALELTAAPKTVEQMMTETQEVTTTSTGVTTTAMAATKTPTTGAETWLLILGTLIINSTLYLYRRKKA